MSLIRLECDSCRTFLQVRAELAGQQGRCPKCGATVTIPAASVAAASPAIGPAAPILPLPASQALGSSMPAPQAISLPARATPAIRSPSPAVSQVPSLEGGAPSASPSLSQATAPDMLAEIARRKKSAVLVVFETPDDASYQISRRPEANVRCYRTADMSDVQVMQVLGELGQMTQGQRNAKGGLGLRPDAEAPFELKGDRLGMTLVEFKQKYARTVGGVKMPYTSDSFPGQANPSLWSEPWHAAAGIVHARVELPSEGNSPTIAGVKTDLFLYQFVDGKLYRITVLFDTEAFHLVREAMVQKHGPPTQEFKERVELAWENSVSTIRVVRGTMRPKKSSSLLLIHRQLQGLAEGRTPQRDEDL
jgi:hypothetical protein